MSDFILSSNMNLPIPIVGITSGPNYAIYLDSCLNRVDGHTHLTGSGVPITPAALNINSAVDMLGWSLINTEAVEFSLQTSSPSNSSIFSKTDGNLYFTNSTGGVVQITNGLQVNASSSGIISGTASAAFSSNVLVVNEATSTPANIQAGSILIGNNLINSNFVTLSAPSALGSGYTLVLPAIPAQKNVMTLDASGNMSSITYDQVGQSMTSVGADAIGSSMSSVGANAIGSSMSSAGADAIAASRTRAVAATVGVGGVAISSAITFSNSSTEYGSSPEAVTITTSGRPVYIGLTYGGYISNSFGYGSLALSINGSLLYGQDVPPGAVVGVTIPSQALGSIAIGNGSYPGYAVIQTVSYPATISAIGSSAIWISTVIPASAFSWVVPLDAGTYTFRIAIAAGTGGVGTAGTININGPSIIAYEL